MMHIRQVRWLVAICVCPMLVATGCRDSDPPRSHYQDLGTNGRALLPTSSAWQDTAVADGSADWHPFRVPSDEPPVQPDGSSSGGVAADVEAEIKELIDEYNELIGDAPVDEILDYYVEMQRDAVRPVLESGETVAESLAALREKLETALPDDGERVEAAMEALESQKPGMLSIGQLTAESETVLVAQVQRNPAIPTCRLRLIEDEWFLEIPGIDALTAAKPSMDDTATRLAAMLEGLESGTTPAQTVLEQVEAAAAGNDAADNAADPADEDAPDDSDGG